MRRASAIAVLLAGAFGCTDLAAPDATSPRWSNDVEGLISAKCRSCHGEGGALPNLTSYFGAVECRADGVAWVKPGDPGSLLLAALERTDHQGLLTADEATRLRDWVVNGSAAYATLLAHGPGWATPAGGSDFHGKKLAAGGYALAFADPKTVEGACNKCHNQPVAAGGAIACTTCHQSAFTPDHCDGCHGADGDPRPVTRPCAAEAKNARVGKHALHRETPLDPAFPSIPCSTCHVVPTSVLDPGHLDVPGMEDASADVRFDPARVTEGSYDPADHSCSVRACHGMAKVTWTPTATSAVARCDGCHGNPPPSHKIDRCVLCHASGLGADGRPTAATHMNGSLQVGKECNECHGVAPEPVFPGDDPGKHRTHLTASNFARVLDCTACHVVPTAVDSVGHLDSPLPADLAFGAVATSSGALTPTFDVTTRRCSDVYCHGARLDGGARTTPAWTTATTTEPVVCGSCHALPPTTARNGAAMHPATGSTDCGLCHVTPENEPITHLNLEITEAGKSAHIDGCVELFPELRPQGVGECRR